MAATGPADVCCVEQSCSRTRRRAPPEGGAPNLSAPSQGRAPHLSGPAERPSDTPTRTRTHVTTEEQMQTRTSVTAASLLMLAALGACQPEGAVDDTAAVDTASVLESMDSLRSGYQQAVADGDWERLGTMVSEDALVVNAGGAAWDSLAAASDAPFPEGATLEVTPRETRVLSADWVYEIGTGEVTWTPEGADEPRTLRDTYLVLLHRTEDGWKLHREVASSRPLPDAEQ